MGTEVQQPSQPPAINAAGLDAVASIMRDSARRYVEIARKSLGWNLQSLTVFGRVLDGDFQPSRETADSVVILDHTEPTLMRDFAAHGPRLGKDGWAAPLVVTSRFIAASKDTFPLEFLEIQQHSVTVVGIDHFADLAFEESHIRLECERELKRLMVGLAQGLLASAGKERAAAPLEREAADILARTLRGVLWLSGARRPIRRVDLTRQVEEKLNRKFIGIHAALCDPQPGWEEFDRLFRDVESLGEAVNAW